MRTGDAYIAVAGLPPRTDVRALSEERQLQQSLSEGEESRHSSSSNVMLIPGGASQTGGEGSSEGGEAAFVRPPPLRRQNTASSLDPASSQANLTHLMNPLNQFRNQMNASDILSVVKLDGCCVAWGQSVDLSRNVSLFFFRWHTHPPLCRLFLHQNELRLLAGNTPSM